MLISCLRVASGFRRCAGARSSLPALRLESAASATSAASRGGRAGRGRAGPRPGSAPAAPLPHSLPRPAAPWLTRLANAALRGNLGDEAVQRTLASTAVDNLQRLGPTFVKVGQVASIRCVLAAIYACVRRSGGGLRALGSTAGQQMAAAVLAEKIARQGGTSLNQTHVRACHRTQHMTRTPFHPLICPSQSNQPICPPHSPKSWRPSRTQSLPVTLPPAGRT